LNKECVIEKMTQGEDVWQQDAYKGVLVKEGRGKRELEKTAY
jgi:hypothetical protein